VLDEAPCAPQHQEEVLHDSLLHIRHSAALTTARHPGPKPLRSVWAVGIGQPGSYSSESCNSPDASRVWYRCVLWPPLRSHLTQGVPGSEKQGGWGVADHGMGVVCPVVWGQVVGNGGVLGGAEVGGVARVV
jgi:hypothetical protein